MLPEFAPTIVDFPIDTVVLENDSYHTMRSDRAEELEQISAFWNERPTKCHHELPADTFKESGFEPNFIFLFPELGPGQWRLKIDHSTTYYYSDFRVSLGVHSDFTSYPIPRVAKKPWIQALD